MASSVSDENDPFSSCKQQKRITTWQLGQRHMIVACNFQGNPSMSRVVRTGMLQKRRCVDTPNTCTIKKRFEKGFHENGVV